MGPAFVLNRQCHRKLITMSLWVVIIIREVTSLWLPSQDDKRSLTTFSGLQQTDPFETCSFPLGGFTFNSHLSPVAYATLRQAAAYHSYTPGKSLLCTSLPFCCQSLAPFRFELRMPVKFQIETWIYIGFVLRQQAECGIAVQIWM